MLKVSVKMASLSCIMYSHRPSFRVVKKAAILKKNIKGYLKSFISQQKNVESYSCFSWYAEGL